MKHVFIIGARGYHAKYGGWETFVSNLVDYYDDKRTVFHISMYTDNKLLKEEKIGDNIIVNPVYVGVKGSAKMFLYTVKAFKYYIKYVEEKNIDNPYFYILGLKLFNYLKLKRRKIKKLGINIIVNPDGLEWMRSKWSYPIKKFFLMSEKLMLNYSDQIVCDSLGIEEYVLKKYPNLKGKTTYIAYGYEEVDLKKVNQNKIMNEYNIKKNDYLLIVGRCVPENNYELIIGDFMKSKINKNLVIISNLSSTDYSKKLKEIAEGDKRIIFIDGVYDKEKLAIIRKNAFAYIHGHSVGGTNPSLIESLSLTDLNILYDVCFNRYAGEDSCLYFKEEGSLTELLDDEKELENQKKLLGPKAKKRVKENFTWKIITDKYKKIFK